MHQLMKTNTIAIVIIACINRKVCIKSEAINQSKKSNWLSAVEVCVCETGEETMRGIEFKHTVRMNNLDLNTINTAFEPGLILTRMNHSDI